MRACALVFLWIAAALIAADKKIVGSGRGENEDLILSVTIHADPESIKELVGDDLGGHYIVARVKVEPKYGKEIAIDRDDFQLRTDKDGDKAKPFAASQIAGRGAIVLSRRAGSGGGGGLQTGSPTDYPGGYPPGYPPPVGGGGPPVMMPNSGISGGGGGGTSEVQAKVSDGAGEKENPLQKVLNDKILPEKKSDQPASGLLYFPMEKQKLKDLELTYGGRENRIRIRFK